MPTPQEESSITTGPPPPEVQAALREYGSSINAWESGDEEAWELLDRWGY